MYSISHSGDLYPWYKRVLVIRLHGTNHFLEVELSRVVSKSDRLGDGLAKEVAKRPQLRID